jgi:hypothetical protein
VALELTWAEVFDDYCYCYDAGDTAAGVAVVDDLFDDDVAVLAIEHYAE